MNSQNLFDEMSQLDSDLEKARVVGDKRKVAILTKALEVCNANLMLSVNQAGETSEKSK